MPLLQKELPTRSDYRAGSRATKFCDNRSNPAAENYRIESGFFFTDSPKGSPAKFVVSLVFVETSFTSVDSAREAESVEFENSFFAI